ncbi:hypothetical protein FVE85_0182 [Porphyridium purpureum]|uniref:Uncharacterized protein n=1 Tax=Porphyridium purpureum TaxID=35688 RepID=A0A5J4Z0S4_PORPP|nr:hypothetical protein FVE85_0182 [Porphyridium purpureum]|eukprot:POR6260..scf208_2
MRWRWQRVVVRRQASRQLTHSRAVYQTASQLEFCAAWKAQHLSPQREVRTVFNAQSRPLHATWRRGWADRVGGDEDKAGAAPQEQAKRDAGAVHGEVRDVDYRSADEEDVRPADRQDGQYGERDEPQGIEQGSWQTRDEEDAELVQRGWNASESMPDANETSERTHAREDHALDSARRDANAGKVGQPNGRDPRKGTNGSARAARKGPETSPPSLKLALLLERRTRTELRRRVEQYYDKRVKIQHMRDAWMPIVCRKVSPLAVTQDLLALLRLVVLFSQADKRAAEVVRELWVRQGVHTKWWTIFHTRLPAASFKQLNGAALLQSYMEREMEAPRVPDGTFQEWKRAVLHSLAPSVQHPRRIANILFYGGRIGDLEPPASPLVRTWVLEVRLRAAEMDLTSLTVAIRQLHIFEYPDTELFVYLMRSWVKSWKETRARALGGKAPRARFRLKLGDLPGLMSLLLASCTSSVLNAELSNETREALSGLVLQALNGIDEPREFVNVLHGAARLGCRIEDADVVALAMNRCMDMPLYTLQLLDALSSVGAPCPDDEFLDQWKGTFFGRDAFTTSTTQLAGWMSPDRLLSVVTSLEKWGLDHSRHADLIDGLGDELVRLAQREATQPEPNQEQYAPILSALVRLGVDDSLKEQAAALIPVAAHTQTVS